MSCATVTFAKETKEAPATLQPELPEISVYEPISTDDDGLSRQTRAALPSRYNSQDKNLITPVKNQNPYGTCWSFSAMSACETSMIKKGLANTSVDLSEHHFAYFFYYTQPDPLGNTVGDQNYLTSGDYLQTGGTDICSVFALSKWTGAAPESLAPYPTSSPAALDASLAYEDIGHLQNARYVSTQDKTSMKQMIMDYGSVSIPIYMSPTLYLNADTGAYYCYDAKQTNHQLTVVGWDDSYSKNNFVSMYNPSGNGAWIAKNSYGTSHGDNGYIYISYEDMSLTSSGSLAFAYDMESADNYSNNYQYDGSASCIYRSFTKGGSLANTFTVKGNPGNQERLDAVSFAIASSNVQYSIQIYKNPPADNPTGGIAVFDTAQTGITTYCGYYTIPLKQKVVFNQGDRFSVVISYAAANSGPVYFFTDEDSRISTLNFNSSAPAGQSFYKSNGYLKWTDMGSQLNANNRIKAFTTNTTEPATVVLPNVSELAIPGSHSLKAIECRDIRISWSAVIYADGYTLYRSTSKNKGYKVIADVKGLSYTDTNLTPGKRYYYKIKAHGAARYQTAFSPTSAAFSIQLLPSKVSFSSLKKAGNAKAQLTWKQVTGASGYEIYRKTDSGSWTKLKTIKKGSTTKLKAKASKNKTNKYRIRAYKTVKGKKIYGKYSKTRKINF